MSDATTTARTIKLDIKEPTAWGPHLEQIEMLMRTESRTGSSRWKLVFWQSIDGKDWAGPYDFLTADLGYSRTIQAATATRTAFGLEMRFALVEESASVGSPDSAVVSAALAFQFLT